MSTDSTHALAPLGRRIRRCLPGGAALLTGALLAVPSQAQCVVSGPSSLDPGLMTSITTTCDHPFLSLLQLGVDPNFLPGINLVLTNGVPQGGGNYSSTFNAQVPWVSAFDDLYFRAFALDTVNGGIDTSNTLRSSFFQGERVYRESEPGLFVIEMEFEQPVDDWQFENAESGFSGSGYLVWKGSNHFNQCGNGIITFPIQVDTPGQYALALHSYHVGGHENNDVWVFINDRDCKKVFSSGTGSWVWTTAVDPGNGGYKETLDAGIHYLNFSARSKDFCIDRIHLFSLDEFSRSQIEDLGYDMSNFNYEQ